MKPFRFQLSRRRPMPPNSMSVARPTRWGNPFKITDRCPRDQSIDAFERYLLEMDPAKRQDFLAPLRGKNLGCWCKESERCHADVLLKWANS